MDASERAGEPPTIMALAAAQKVIIIVGRLLRRRALSIFRQQMRFCLAPRGRDKTTPEIAEPSREGHFAEWPSAISHFYWRARASEAAVSAFGRLLAAFKCDIS